MSRTELHEQLTMLAGVPALLVAAGAPAAAAERGTVLLLHGLTGSKDDTRGDAHGLAERGYLAVALDAVGHGARRYADFEQRFAADRGEASFFDLVQRSAQELPGVLDALATLGWALPGRVGACGTSMGGFILFGALTARCALDAVAVVIASPRWVGVADSPHQRLDRYAPTPLLIQTAALDATVPPGDARALHDALVPRYAAHPDRLRYLEYPGETHALTEPTWRRVWDEQLAWMGHHLAPATAAR